MESIPGSYLNLVHCWDDLAGWIVEELLKVLDSEVGDTNVLDTAGSRKFLHLLPA